jgi:hypothetical protein
MDLSLKHETLPKELQAKQTPFEHYMLVGGGRAGRRAGRAAALVPGRRSAPAARCCQQGRQACLPHVPAAAGVVCSPLPSCEPRRSSPQRRCRAPPPAAPAPGDQGGASGARPAGNPRPLPAHHPLELARPGVGGAPVQHQQWKLVTCSSREKKDGAQRSLLLVAMHVLEGRQAGRHPPSSCTPLSHAGPERMRCDRSELQYRCRHRNSSACKHRPHRARSSGCNHP